MCESEVHLSQSKRVGEHIYSSRIIISRDAFRFRTTRTLIEKEKHHDDKAAYDTKLIDPRVHRVRSLIASVFVRRGRTVDAPRSRLPLWRRQSTLSDILASVVHPLHSAVIIYFFGRTRGSPLFICRPFDLQSTRDSRVLSTKKRTRENA